MAWILAHFALSTGVEKDAIEEDKAFSHVAKIWLSWDAIVDWLQFEIQNLKPNRQSVSKIWTF